MPANCSIIGSDNELDLFCLVLNASNIPFSVTIGESRTVDRLKKSDKESDGARSLIAVLLNSIMLWKVSTFLLACAG